MLRRIGTTKPCAGIAINWGHPLTGNLLASWITNEAAGAAIHDSVSFRRGDFIGGMSWEGTSRGIMTRFSGSNSYIDCGDMPELNGLSQLTISTWLYRRGGTLYDGIISRSTNNDFGIELAVAGALGGLDDLFFRISPTNGDYGYTTDGSLPLNMWVHVAAVFDGTQTGNSNRAKLFVNGVQKTLTFVGAFPAVTPTVTRPLRIGRLEYSSGAVNNYFNGVIDFPTIWARALSADEVKQLYTNPYQILRPQAPRLFVSMPRPRGVAGIINNPISI